MSRHDDVRSARQAGDAWAEQVWESTLPPLQRLVALVYADHVRTDERDVWVTMLRLRQRTGLSRSAAQNALAGLREAGWLVVVTEARQRFTAHYAPTTPVEVTPALDDAQAPGSRASESAQGPGSQASEPYQGPGSRAPDEPRGPADDPRGPGGDPRGPARGPYHSPYLSSYPSARASEESLAPPVVAGSSHTAGKDDPRRGEAERAAKDAGVEEHLRAAFVERVLADASTEHSIGGRITGAHAWRERHLSAVRGQHAGARRADDVADQALAIFARVEAAGEPGRRAIATARAAMSRRPDDRSLALAREAERELRDHHDAAVPDAPAVSA